MVVYTNITFFILIEGKETPNSNQHQQEFLVTAVTLRILPCSSSRIRMSALVVEWGCFNRTLLRRKI